MMAGALLGATGCGADCVVVDDHALELVVPDTATVLLDGPPVEGCGPEEGMPRRGEAWIRDAEYRWFYGEIGESIGTDDMGRPAANELRGTIKSGQPPSANAPATHACTTTAPAFACASEEMIECVPIEPDPDRAWNSLALHPLTIRIGMLERTEDATPTYAGTVVLENFGCTVTIQGARIRQTAR